MCETRDDVTLFNKKQVILRISRDQYSEFGKEKWAIDRVQKLGVPVPEILLIKKIHLEGQIIPVCVQKKIEGEPLERGSIKYWELENGQLKKIIKQAGKILSMIHSCPTEDFGGLDKNGKGWSKTFQDLMSEHLDKEADFRKLAEDTGFDKDIIKIIFEILAERAKTAPTIRPVLNHSDFAPKHFMVKDDSIIGILDWGTVCGHSPINDFAMWSFWFDDIPLEWLQEGYLNQDIFGKSFEETLNWIKLNNGLEAIWWYYTKGYYQGVLESEARIRKVIKYFE